MSGAPTSGLRLTEPPSVEGTAGGHIGDDPVGAALPVVVPAPAFAAEPDESEVPLLEPLPGIDDRAVVPDVDDEGYGNVGTVSGSVEVPIPTLVCTLCPGRVVPVFPGRTVLVWAPVCTPLCA